MIRSIFFVLLAEFLLIACSSQVTKPAESGSTPTAKVIQSTATEIGTRILLPSETAQPKFTSQPTETLAVMETATPEPTSTPTPGRPLAGIESNQLYNPDRLQLVKNAGANWTRYSVLEWDKIEPEKLNPPKYNWRAAEETGMQMAKEAGLELIAVIKFAPAWAQKIPGVACGAIAEDAIERFAMFTYEAVRRYSQPPFSIKYWEIGNEIDVSPEVVPAHNPFGCWGDRSDPYYGGGYYSEVLKAIYPQIKLADPEAQVLVGGLLMDCDPENPPANADCTSSKFLEGILVNSGGGYFDGVSFHAYDYYTGSSYGNPNWNTSSTNQGPAFVRKADYLNSLLLKYNVSGKYLMLTEVALLCGSKGNEDYCKTEDFQQTKRAYITQSMTLARAMNIRAAVWYSLEGWRASGLFDGFKVSQPSYQVFQFSSGFISDARWVKKIDINPQVMALEFLKNGKRYWVMWSLTKEAVPIDLPEMPAVIYNAKGEDLPVNKKLVLTFETIYIEWND